MDTNLFRALVGFFAVIALAVAYESGAASRNDEVREIRRESQKEQELAKYEYRYLEAMHDKQRQEVHDLHNQSAIRKAAADFFKDQVAEIQLKLRLAQEDLERYHDDLDEADRRANKLLADKTFWMDQYYAEARRQYDLWEASFWSVDLRTLVGAAPWQWKQVKLPHKAVVLPGKSNSTKVLGPLGDF